MGIVTTLTIGRRQAYRTGAVIGYGKRPKYGLGKPFRLLMASNLTRNMNTHKVVEKSLLFKRALAIVNCRRDQELPAITYLKPKQVDCLRHCVWDQESRDVLAVLATGYGKSLLFELIPVYCELVTRPMPAAVTPVTLVMSPLNVIIDQQMKTLGNQARRLPRADHGDSVSSTGSESEDESDKSIRSVADGDFQFLIGHPEDFLEEDNMTAMKRAPWNSRVCHIVVDEAHCVVQWGENFRPLYRSIDTVKALFSSSKPRTVALTATASVLMQREIIRILDMDHPAVIVGQTDRSNVKLRVERRLTHAGKDGVEASYTEIFMPLLKELKEKRGQFPQTVVYTSLKWCGFGNELGVKVLADGAVTSVGVKEVSQYHAPLMQEMKSKVAADMSSPAGEIRLLLATQAYGMGVDAKHIRRIVHAGSPTTLEAYAQEIGRAGRDGEPAEAILYFNKEDLGRRTVRDEVRDYCLLSSCRREFLSQHFGSGHEPISAPHNCCDNCELTCSCHACLSVSIPSQESPKSTMNNEKAVEIRDILMEVFCAIHRSMDTAMDVSLVTGLTPWLATDVGSNFHIFSDLDTMAVNYHYIDPDYVKLIYEVLQQYIQ